MKKVIVSMLGVLGLLLVSGCEVQSNEEFERDQFISAMKDSEYQQVSDNVYFTNTEDHDILNEQIKLILKDHPGYEVDEITQLMKYTTYFHTDGVYITLRKK